MLCGPRAHEKDFEVLPLILARTARLFVPDGRAPGSFLSCLDLGRDQLAASIVVPSNGREGTTSLLTWRKSHNDEVSFGRRSLVQLR